MTRLSSNFFHIFTKSGSGFVTDWFMPASNSSEPSAKKKEKCVG